MSILIRGMEMPTSCEDCPCAYFTEGAHHDFCQAVGYDSEIKRGSGWKLNNCPLVPVPPHGRLIDVDELYNHVFYARYDDGIDPKEIAAIPWSEIYKLERIPTIIPAEEGER